MSTPTEKDYEKAREIMQNAGKYQNENRLDKVIAHALAQAREDAIEEAAKLCMSGSAYLPTCCSRECYENARVIRALKERKP